MGILSDILLDVLDNASGGMVSLVRAGKAMSEYEEAEKQNERFKDANKVFDRWIRNNSENYEAVRDALNSKSYLVKRSILHSGKNYQKEDYPEEIEEDERRKKLLEDLLEKLKPDFVIKSFKNYLEKSEQCILDSYSDYRIFQVEMSYLPNYQREIVDSMYLEEIKELLQGKGSNTLLSSINDMEWQIERHKVPAGHAIAILTLLQKVYNDQRGLTEKIKSRIDEILTKADEIIINNTYKAYLSEDADTLDAEAMLEMGKEAFLSGEPEKGFAYYLHSAKKGNAEAQYRTGDCFYRGYGVFKNKEKATYWYQKSSESNTPTSKYYRAIVYCEMLPEDQRDYDKAYKLYLEAFNEGVAEAADNIGNMYAYGNGFEQNDNAAADWYKKGASAGSLWSMYHLYEAYLKGKGVEVNKENAKQWFTKCVESFDIDSDNGKKIFDLGNDELPLYLAFEYYSGSDVIDKNTEKSIFWGSKGTLIGDIKSIDLLGCLLLNTSDKSKAMELFHRSAKYGNSYSINRIGFSFYNGEVYPKDKASAATWFMCGAKFGNKLSQQNIACAFLWGDFGVPKDIKEARYWFTLSAKQGNEESQKMLDDLDKEDEKKHRQEDLENLNKEKEKLAAEKNNLLEKISEVDKKIENASSQREEDSLINEKNKLDKKKSDLDLRINDIDNQISTISAMLK